MKNLGAYKMMRIRLFGMAALILPFVLTTGFFTAGTSAGIACNTFPKVGEHWFISRKHFMADIPVWKNFVENKLVCQVNHRTIACILTGLTSYHCINFLRMPGLPRASKAAALLLLTALWMQVSLGIKTIWESVPIHLASLHQIGAVCVMSSFLFALHTCRGVDARHLRNLYGKLRVEDP